jgi:carbon-monoxide dehydrogenase iron sulfur subunit
MNQSKKDPLNIKNILPPPLQTRRSFIKTLTIAGTAVTLGVVLPEPLLSQKKESRPDFSMILVDFNKCTGCRTCETVCSQFNHQVSVEGETLWGLGNPHLSNIRVYPFNPDVDVPVVCAMCKDNPCIKACPVEPDENGHRALYRNPRTLAIKNNPERCIACGACAEACRNLRVGAIIPDPQTRKPERLCTLCDGDPQCVKYCPYGALTHVVDGLDGKHYGMSAEKIAEALMKRWYGSSTVEGGIIK